MLLSLLPAMGVTASAAETGSGTADDPYVVTSYEELQTAMQKAGGGYVRLGANIDTTKMNAGYGIGENDQIIVNANVALDLNGYKVTLSKSKVGQPGFIDVRFGSLTIEDSKGGGELNGKNMTTASRMYLIYCYGDTEVTVNSGTLSMWSAQTATTANAVIRGVGTVEINGGTLAISNEKNYDEVDLYLNQQDFAVEMTSNGSAVINGGTFKGRVLLYAHAKSAGKAGSVINGGDFEKSVYVRKDRTETGDVPLDVSIRGGTYRYNPGYRTNKEGKTVSDPQDMFQFATQGFLDTTIRYYDQAPYFHGTDPKEGELDKYDLTAFKSLFPDKAILVAKGIQYTHWDYRSDNTATQVRLGDSTFTGADDKTVLARLMNSEYKTIDVINTVQLEDATLTVGDTTVPDNGGNVTTGDKAITITGRGSKRIAQLVQDGKIALDFSLRVVKNPKASRPSPLDTSAATFSSGPAADGRLNVTVKLPSAKLEKADYSVRLDLFPKKPGASTIGGEEAPCSWRLSADDANHRVTINYNANGGGGWMNYQQVMSGKQPYTLPDCTFTAPTGQVFKGWSTTQDGTVLLSDGKLPLTEVGSSVTVYAIWGVPTEMEIDKVTLTVKPYSQRQDMNDFRVADRTPYKETSVRGFWIYEGLNTNSGSQAGTYDKTKDYSVIYEFTATLGYQFAENISVDDVSANDGEVWQVKRLTEGKTLQVCVNYRSGDSIKGMQLKVKEPLAGDSSRDDAYEIRSTDGRYAVEYTNWYQGEFTNNGQISGAPFSGNFAAGEKYTCAFCVIPSSGYKVAHGYTNGLFLNGAQVTNCKELNPTGDDAGGYFGLYTFTVMDTSDKISKVGIQVKPEAERTDISTDFGPKSFTPASRMEFRTYQIYEGLDQIGGAIPDKYDPAKDYSAIYEFTTGEIYSFAEGISKADVTINDGAVWQVKRLNEGKTLQVYVNFPSSSNPNRVKEVSMTMKSKGDFKTIEDLKCQSFTPADKLELVNQMFFAGLKDTANEHQIKDLTTAYQPAADYTVCYVFKLKPGFSFAQDITDLAKKHVTISEGEIYSMDDTMTATDGAKLLRVFVSFEGTGSSSSSIKQVTLNTRTRSEIDQAASAYGFMLTSYTPSDKMSYGLKVMVGLDQDETGPSLESGKFDAKQDYTVLYNLQPKDDFAFAEGFSAKDVTVTNGTVYKVEMSGKNCYVYVNFPAAGTPASQEVSNVHLNFRPVGLRDQVAHISPVNWTPGAGSIELYNIRYYQGENTDADANELNGEVAYDRSKAYSVSFQLIGKTGVVFADGFDANSITLSDGKVWKVQRIDKGNVVVCVTFPASGDTATKINAINLTIKPQEQRKALVDFVPTAITPEGMSVTSTNIYKDGTLYTGSYDANTAYYVGYSLNTKSGYAFADGFKKENVTVSNGTVDSVSVVNNNYVIVYVNFPAAGPTPVTETIEKIHLDFKLRSARTTIGDLIPSAQKPGTDKMELTEKDFYEGKYSGTNPQEETAAYDSSKEYLASFRYNCKSGVNMAKDFTMNDVTLSDGRVRQIVRQDSYVIIEVIFPPASTAVEEINELHLTFKPHSDRKAQKDLEPISIAPDNKAYFVQLISVKEGLGNTGTETSDYDSTKDYFAILYIRAKEGYSISKKIDEKAVTGINGQVIEAFSDNADPKALFVYVNFPAKAAEDPNYVTEVAVQVAAPVAGETPSNTGITVTSSNADKIKRALVLWHGTSYVAGQEYSPTVYLEPKSGVTFAKNLKLKVNGKDAEFLFADPDGSVQFKTKITAVDSSTPAPIEYNVTVTSGGNGSASVKPAKAVAGTEIKLTATADSGYHFKEWKVVKGGVTVKDNKFTMPAANVEIEAVFEKDAPAEYTVKFDGNGGKASKDEMTTNNQKLAKLPDATRSGKYQFDGWYMKKDGGTKITTATVFDQNTTVYAHWTYTGGGSSGGGGGSSVTTYAITAKSAKNGDVTASHKTASKGTTVTLTVDPDKGYVLDTLTVLDSKDKAVKLTEKNGKYTFTMPAGKVTVSAAFKAAAPASENPFTDVPSGAYYEGAVIWAVKEDITSGTSATTFEPDGNCTRAQAVTFLWRAAGSPEPKSAAMPFTDVPAGSYFEKAVLWAVENGITKGTSDTTFTPDASCTRAQIVTFLWRANGSHAVSGNSAFSDVAADAYYAAAVAWAEKNGVTGGIGGGLFGSDNTCTRAQIVTFLHRAMK